MRRTTIFAIAVLLLAATAMSAHAATITVTNTNDSGPGSLRQALANANDGDTINFAVTGTITLTSGGLGITKNVTISGPGANQLAVNGNQALFAFGVFPQRTVSISGLRIRNAQVGVYNNQGTVSVSNCVLSGNSGAGLYNHVGASMTVANSNISNNSGTGADNNQGTLTVTSCVLSDNSNAGIFNSGTVTVSNCALIGNSGGMTSFGTLTVSYCEISGNSGDGIFNGGTLTVSNCALSGNSGDGIGNRAFSSGTASLTIVNSNVSDNHSIGISNYVDEFAILTTTIRSTTVSAAVIHLQATTITVTNTNDSGPDSLRQALANANDGDTINFAVTGTIGLTSGELLVDKSVTISGPGAATLAVDGNFTSRVFHIGSGKTVSISGLTLTNGSAGFENGGGILNDHAILTMDSCVVHNSCAQAAVAESITTVRTGSAALTILNSTVTLNGAFYAGGGIYNDADNSGSATLAIMNSIVGNNTGAGFADNVSLW